MNIYITRVGIFDSSVPNFCLVPRIDYNIMKKRIINEQYTIQYTYCLMLIIHITHSYNVIFMNYNV